MDKRQRAAVQGMFVDRIRQIPTVDSAARDGLQIARSLGIPHQGRNTETGCGESRATSAPKETRRPRNQHPPFAIHGISALPAPSTSEQGLNRVCAKKPQYTVRTVAFVP
jgi:hypothetical protein